MDRRLLDAAISGDASGILQLASRQPSLLFETTPQGNTCFHIASIHGHEGFCKDILALSKSQSLLLLGTINADGETPLIAAVTRSRAAFASVLLGWCHDRQLSEAILKQGKHGCNALHHAIRRGYRTLAFELIEAEPALSKGVNERAESPMFIAAMRNFMDVFDVLLEIPDSAHSGACGYNVLHAAVRNGNSGIVKRVMETRPWLVKQENELLKTPIHQAASEDKVHVLTLLLEHNRSLGYQISTDGLPLLWVAAYWGHVGVARELLKHCPDAPYSTAEGSTCLHIAVQRGHIEFVGFVLESQHLQHLVNMANDSGDTALHLADKISDDSNKDMLIARKKAEDEDDTASAPPAMDSRLLEAATTGDAKTMQSLAMHDPGVLLGTTPQGNTCLHIACIHGHERLCEDALSLNKSLLTTTNLQGETPLLTAVISGRVPLASFLLGCCREEKMREAILKQDGRGCNALHHAIRCGHRELALKLIEAEPDLSLAVNKYGESAMFMVVMRNYADVFEKLLEVPDSAHAGARCYNALHAAVRNGNSALTKRIMETRPKLATVEDKNNNTPMQLAVHWDKIDVLRVMLEHDRFLGYIISGNGNPLLVCAAYRGHVGVAREILKHCPDALYCVEDGWTCLHQAVLTQKTEFVEFVLGSPQLRSLINLRDSDGDTALHLAVKKCNPKIVSALLLHQDRDVTLLNNIGNPANWSLARVTENAKTLNWNEVSMLMLEADPEDARSIDNLHKDAMEKVTKSSREHIKSLTQTYTGNNSLVAILIATITFAAAFTLPGGYSTDPGNEGLPILSRKYAFQAFLISDTLAMCSSLAVAFICVIAKWEDLEFLLYYRSFTKKLMWFAYVATTTAFSTGLYTVLAPHLFWLAITVCVLTSLLPILTKLLGEWPILKLRFRLGRTFKSELLDMV
ncbi:hypothetical protein HU200_016671 [Digitaria exilis]|uniref:PGG domain-containing protein n=1 Tax=Digitaria exilis TaxID=1010633 RepID=A0A835KI26_9POAL|nr:hypothetical protein HU200_016671 [Digitaria exilis]